MAQIAEPAVAAPPAAPKVVRNLDGLAIPPPKYIVGLDFGTTYSGFSFTKYQDVKSQGGTLPENVRFFENLFWPDHQLAYEKTPTVGLYNKDNQMISWGWTAEIGRKEFLEFFFAHKFKLHLAELEEDEPDTRPPLPPFAVNRADGVVIVIAHYLRFMKNFLLPLINGINGAVIKQDEIRWCLTVPAVWSEKAKLKMNRAAQLAGLVQGRLTPVGEGSPHPLQIVLEPEAASLYCLYWLKSLNDASYDINSAYLVVDLGGGTADLAMHGFQRVGDNVKLVELQQGTGGLCGGSHIDDCFYAYLKEHVENWDGATSGMPKELHRLRECWELAKRSFTGDEIQSIFIEIPFKIAALLVQYYPDACDDGGISIDIEIMKNFFERVLAKIKRLINQQIETFRQNQDPKIADKPIKLFFVGGLSESEYVRKCVEALIAEQNKRGLPVIRMISPPKPGIAIARGACLFGLNPHVFHSRCVRRSYATEAYRLAVPSDPKKEQIRRPDGKFEVKACVTSIYEGNIVEEGKPIKKPFKPHNPGDQKIIIPLLTWTYKDPNAPEPEFSSDKRIEPAGINLEVIMPPADELKNDTIIVEMEFNGPTISIKGYPQENVDMAVTVLLNLDDDAAEE